MPRTWSTQALIVVILIASILYMAPAFAQESATTLDPVDHWDGVEVAEAISQTTGLAISPLLGVGALGAWTYFQYPEEQRHQLPWFAQMWFWLPALLVVVLMVAKDPLLGFIPIVKKPLDALDVVEDKISAVLASAVAAPMLFSVLSRAIPANEVAGAAGGSPVYLTLSMGSILSGATGTALVALAVVGLMAAFFVTWLAAHTINVLILLSPFGPLDILLRAIKGLLLVVLLIATLIAPILGLLVSALIVIVAWKISGWSFRWTVFGTVLAWDILTFKSRRFDPESDPIRAFSGPGLVGVAPRTFGELRRPQGAEPSFSYHPWLVLPTREVAIPTDDLEIGKGLFAPVMFSGEGEGEDRALLRFPPRFLGHEEVLAERIGAKRVRLLGIRKHVGGLWDWLKATLADLTGKTSTATS